MARIRRYAARWATDQEQNRHQGANGIVEDVTFNPPEFVCAASPMGKAKRIANSLNFCSRFEDSELDAVSAALINR